MRITHLFLFLFIYLLVSGCSKRRETITSLKMLEGAKEFAVPTGTVADQFVLKKFPDAKIRYFNTVLDCALAVKNEKADAACYDLPVLKNIASKNEGMSVLSEVLVDDKYGFAVQLGNAYLKKKTDSVLATLKKDGTYADMMKRWFPEQGAPAPMPVLDFSKTSGVLKFGTAAVTEPMAFIDKEHHIVGFDIEFASRIALVLNKKLEITDMEFGALLPSLIAGKVDMIGAGLSITEERAKSVLFADSYYTGGIAALVKKETRPASGESGMKLSSVKDLKGKRLGVLLGSAFDTYAKQNFPEEQLLQFSTLSDLITALKSEKIDVMFTGSLQIKQILSKNKGLSVLAENLFVSPMGVSFSKDNPGLKKQFDEFMKELKSSGKLDEIYDRWFNKDITDFPTIDTPNKNGSLRAGIEFTIGLPRSTILNGEMIGFDVEISRRFAAYLGKEFIPVDLALNGMLASLKTGKIDMAGTCLMITEERQKLVDFSEPFLNAGACLLALEKNMARVQAKLKGIDDIKNKRLGVLLGSIHDAYAIKNFPDATVLEFQNIPDIITALKANKVDAAFSDHISLREIFERNPDLGILAANIYSTPIAVAFNKDNPALREKFNSFLKEIKGNGIYDDMTDRWMNRNVLSMPDIPDNGTRGTLRAAILGDAGLPSAIRHEGKLIGFDIELTRRFASYLDMKFEPVDIPFPSIIASLAAKKVDLISCQLCVTEERKKQVDFSDPYLESGMSIYARKDKIDPVGKKMGGVNASTASVAEDDQNENKTGKKSIFKSFSDGFYSNIIHEKRYLLILNGLKLTLVISVLASILGTIIGGLICFMRMSRKKILFYIAGLYINILRGTPVLVLLMIIFYVVFASVNINPALVAVIAFGLNFGAYVSEMFRTSIESIDKGQKEAGIAGGFTKVQTFIYIIMPQALRQVLPVYKGEFISLVKMTSVVGYIAVQDLTKASDIIRSRTFDAFFPLIMAAVIYLAISWLFTWALGYVEIAANPKRKGSNKEGR